MGDWEIGVISGRLRHNPGELAGMNNNQVQVVQKVDNAIHWINLYSLNSAIGFANTYLLDSYLSCVKRFPVVEQTGPGG